MEAIALAVLVLVFCTFHAAVVAVFVGLWFRTMHSIKVKTVHGFINQVHVSNGLVLDFEVEDESYEESDEDDMSDGECCDDECREDSELESEEYASHYRRRGFNFETSEDESGANVSDDEVNYDYDLEDVTPILQLPTRTVPVGIEPSSLSI